MIIVWVWYLFRILACCRVELDMKGTNIFTCIVNAALKNCSFFILLSCQVLLHRYMHILPKEARYKCLMYEWLVLLYHKMPLVLSDSQLDYLVSCKRKVEACWMMHVKTDYMFETVIFPSYYKNNCRSCVTMHFSWMFSTHSLFYLSRCLECVAATHLDVWRGWSWLKWLGNNLYYNWGKV